MGTRLVCFYTEEDIILHVLFTKEVDTEYGELSGIPFGAEFRFGYTWIHLCGYSRHVVKIDLLGLIVE